MKPILLLGVLYLTMVSFAQNKLYTVYFKTGSTAISEASQRDLAQLVKGLDSCKDALTLIGYSDGVGNEEKNRQLSLDRIRAVQRFVFSVSRIGSGFIEARGEQEAIANNDTAANEAYRRVDIYPERKLCEEPPADDIADLYRLLRDEGQSFCINPDKDTALIGANGTIVYYKPGTFSNTGGCGCLRLVLHEYFRKSDLILHNLTTTSNSEPLESGGMIKLEGFCGADTLRYQPNKFLTVMVPSDTLLPGMKLLSANRLDAGEILNWQLDKEYPDLDDFDATRMMMFCKFRGRITRGKCPFFFCRIRNFFRGGGKQEKELEKLNNRFGAENALIRKYALDPDKLGKALEEGEKDALKYYVYKNATWDYHNIDRYMWGEKLLDFIVGENYRRSTDVKLVYASTKAVLPSFEGNDGYRFSKVFDNAAVHIVGLKYENKQAFLSLSRENSSSAKAKLNFSAVSIDELKTLLRRLDE